MLRKDKNPTGLNQTRVPSIHPCLHPSLFSFWLRTNSNLLSYLESCSNPPWKPNLALVQDTAIKGTLWIYTRWSCGLLKATTDTRQLHWEVNQRNAPFFFADNLKITLFMCEMRDLCNCSSFELQFIKAVTCTLKMRLYIKGGETHSK